MYHFVSFKDSCQILSLCYLKPHWYFTVWKKMEKGTPCWCWQHTGCFLYYFHEFSKLIKPYHCCVYGSYCHICLCINANKYVWLVLSGMMAISSGKNANIFCAVVVQEQRLILCLSCFIVLNGGLFSCCGLCSKKLHSRWCPISLSERKV